MLRERGYTYLINMPRGSRAKLSACSLITS